MLISASLSYHSDETMSFNVAVEKKRSLPLRVKKTTAFHISQHRRTTPQVNLSTSLDSKLHLTIKPHFKERGNNEN